MTLRIRLLGAVGVLREGEAVPLPRSRKVRALLAFLALEPSPTSRSRLCDLLWDVADDPRGELRWVLSKLRAVLDEPGRRRVLALDSDAVALDLSDALVDALELDRAERSGLGALSDARLEELAGLAAFPGEPLEGLDLDATPEFGAWLTASRRRLVGTQVAVLAEHASRAPAGSEEAFRRLDAWLVRAPLDRRAHERALAGLATAGRIRDAEAHLAAAIRAFEHEGLDWKPLRDAWRDGRDGRPASTPPAFVSRSELAPPVLLAPPAPRLVAPGSLAPAPERAGFQAPRRGSVAVLPFAEEAFPGEPASSGEAPTRIADGLTDDVVTRLAKLRVLFVIARGTTYALRDRGLSAEETGRVLDVEYVVTGAVRRRPGRTSVRVELAETRGARIVWADELDAPAGAPFAVLDAIADRIVAAVAEEIEAAECRRAVLRPPSSFDAWEAYHRGLWHMYRFTGPDNREAERFFRAAIALDPTFSRAHAGLSFTHFQNVFLGLTADREHQLALAAETAAESLAADDRDPAAHWAMGRALWLRGAGADAEDELRRSVELSPNFALGHYTLGFVRSQSGDPRGAIEALDRSRGLSPFDPLTFGMLASRALSHVRLGELAEAAEWASRAVVRPNAHVHILAIGAACLELAGRGGEARKLVARVRERAPGYDVETFLRAFRFGPEEAELFRKAARRTGFG